MNNRLQISKLTLIQRFQKHIIIPQQFCAKIMIVNIDLSIEYSLCLLFDLVELAEGGKTVFLLGEDGDEEVVLSWEG